MYFIIAVIDEGYALVAHSVHISIYLYRFLNSMLDPYMLFFPLRIWPPQLFSRMWNELTLVELAILWPTLWSLLWCGCMSASQESVPECISRVGDREVLRHSHRVIVEVVGCQNVSLIFSLHFPFMFYLLHVVAIVACVSLNWCTCMVLNCMYRICLFVAIFFCTTFAIRILLS